jgi:DNA-binding CsgD family transcriptional regulator
MIGTISFGLHKSMPPISSAQVEALRILAPHLRRAVHLSRLFDASDAAATTFASVLDASTSGILLVDRHMRLLHFNAAGQAMVQADDPIRRNNDHIALINEVIPGQLAETVSDAAVDEAGLGRQAAGIPARRRDGSPIVVHVMPLERRPSGLGIPQRAVAAIVVPNETAEKPSPMEAAAILFSLRPAEVRVFELMAAGRTNVEIAKALGIARSTVKTHALRLFEKLGRNRRSDLIQLAHELSLRF